MAEYRRSAEKTLDPTLLQMENRSKRANFLIGRWYELKGMRDLMVVHGCDDARVGDGVRVFDNPGIISLRSIAAASVYGGNEDFFNWVYGHSSARAIVVAGHYDGSIYTPGSEPMGCGGLKEKKKMADEAEPAHHSRKTTSVVDYVRNLIIHHDPLKQSVVSALRIADAFDKPVVAGLIDHSNLAFKPVLIIDHKGQSIRTAVSLEKLFTPGNQALYENGIPELDFDLSNPDWLFSLREGNQKASQRVPSGQKTQNPHTVVISTEIRPVSIRYPETFGATNTNFCVTLPYVKPTGGVIGFTDLAVSQSLAQAEYALLNAISAEEGQAFSSTRNVLIETPDLDLSRGLAGMFADRALTRQWLDKKRGNIIVSQVNHAETSFMEKFRAA